MIVRTSGIVYSNLFVNQTCISRLLVAGTICIAKRLFERTMIKLSATFSGNNDTIYLKVIPSTV
ncbi:hypothetical protein MtrunA17_Chr4g0009471 [Medicago truncatula]|uniref:Uncharacterized protein n=1 Tax=Medicago truncatula TaxID=3880 RepID=A0A396I0F2_MEDTR|nr:hypothetical protein MtrunA17_Chr7g0262481 [Medicago truncatula]RHN59086.1 hypothetical protein MtrunA17_Chr4g0009471 [Medicago truncatula]